MEKLFFLPIVLIVAATGAGFLYWKRGKPISKEERDRIAIRVALSRGKKRRQ